MSPEPRFWRSLLLKRGEARWGNFTWLSPSVLLQSANDQVAKYIDSTIVNRRRMRWVAAQRATGPERDPGRPVKLRADRIVVVGDPGEMDASQYVLLRDVFAAATDGRDVPAPLLLMSDIVYPAGNVNAWRDAVYLPYFGMPWEEWRAAAWEWIEKDDAAQDSDFPIPPKWPVFATPGNHDWYDGLTGFMFHACAAEPLPPVEWSSEGLTRQQVLSRFLWQRSARPNRAVLDPLRLGAATVWKSSKSPGPMPFQPGPYFSIELERERGFVKEQAIKAGHNWARRHAVRLVCVDTGIDGSIDAEQAIWVREQLRDELPKIVITGKPLVVDQKIERFRIDGGESMDPAPVERGTPDPPKYDDLRHLIQGGHKVIACVAGDTHNAQRMVLSGEEVDDAEIRKRWSWGTAPGSRPPIIRVDGQPPLAVAPRPDPPLPPLQIVAGGGGAYLTETHRVEFGDDGSLTIKDRPDRDDRIRDIDVPNGRHKRFPSREQSVLLFAGEVHGWAVLLALLVVGLGLGAAAALLGFVGQPGPSQGHGGDLDITPWRAALGSLGTAGLAVLGSVLFVTRVPRKAIGQPLVLLSLLAFAALFAFGWSTAKVSDAAFMLGGAALAIGAPLALVGAPLIRAYPSLRRLIPVRTAFVVAAAGLALVPWLRDHAIIIAVALAVLVAVYLRVNRWRRKAREKIKDWTLLGENQPLRVAYAFASMWPIVAVGLLVFAVPQFLLPFDDDAVEFIHLIGAAELLLAFLALAGLCLASLSKAWRTAPKSLLWLMVAGGLAAGMASFPLVDQLDLTIWQEHFADGLIALAIGLGGACVTAGVCIGIFGRKLPAEEKQVSEALEARDLGRPCKYRNMRLFRAMAVAGLPIIGQLAESIEPPFYKSFLVIDLLHSKRPDVLRVQFSIFGLNDERRPGVGGHPASGEENAEDGSFLVDRVEVSVPLEPPMTRLERVGRARRTGSLSPP